MVKQFYCDDDFRPLMPGKKDFVSIEKNKPEQKPLILYNLKEFFAQFKSQHRNVNVIQFVCAPFTKTPHC